MSIPGCSLSFYSFPVMRFSFGIAWRGRPGVPRSAIHFRFHHTSLRRSTPHPPLRKNPPPSSTLQSDSSSHFLHSASCHTLLLSLFVVSCSCFLLFYGIPSSLCMTFFPFPKYAVPFSLLVVGPCLYLIRFRRSHMPSFFRFHFPLSLSPRLAIVFCMVRLLLLCPPPLSHPHHHDSRLFFSKCELSHLPLLLYLVFLNTPPPLITSAILLSARQ